VLPGVEEGLGGLSGVGASLYAIFMSRQTLPLDAALHEWLLGHGPQESSIQRELRAEMATHPEGNMQTAPEQVQFMSFLLKMMAAKRVIEVGVFTGYSALGMAMALPEDGLLIACDLSAEHMAVAKQWWSRGGVAGRIEPRVGPATETLRQLIDAGHIGSFDFIYVDADKTGYDDYYELGLQLLRPGGVMSFDNMLRSGHVADATVQDESTVAIRALAAKMRDDDRVAYSLLPIGDGLGLAMARGGGLG
jgi:predicted O-methyltransferase YrrM